MTPTRTLRGLALACVLAALACRDSVGVDDAPAVADPGFGATVLGEYRCEASIDRGAVTCRDEATGTGGMRRGLLGQGQVKLTSSNVQYDTLTLVFGFDVRLQNLLGEPIGTPDGVEVTGVKVFYEAGPTATSFVPPATTGTVTVRNPDGVANFTRAAQPYHAWTQLLAPGQVSPVKRWELSIPRTVRTFSFAVKVFAARPSDPSVPEQSPDTIPADFYAAARIAEDLAGLRGRYLRDVLSVVFVPGTPLEERQAALDLVRGRVMGGQRGSLPDVGEYFVSLPADTTANTLVAAMDRLNLLPGVAGAAPVFLDRLDELVAYRQPNDGPGWTWLTLEPDGNQGTGAWGLEAVAAPWAWGCETGKADTKVALLDAGFALLSSPDLAVGVDELRFFTDTVAPWSGHGNHVASVMAAAGNNGTGMTGVMWDADVRAYDAHTTRGGKILYAPVAGGAKEPIGHVVDKFWQALGDADHRVINISLGLLGLTEADALLIQAGTPPPGLVAQRRARVASVRRWLRIYRFFGRDPLMVVAAGNDRISAEWSGWSELALSFPDQVITVGAVESDVLGPAKPGGPYKLADFSNHGPLVEIAAPGVDVTTLNGQGNKEWASGTSVSAPLVTGAAGLLFSFDPTLTTGEVKALLIEGARAGGRHVPNPGTAGTIPILNVHESLKLAAQRPGAPLCGNRVWSEGGEVFAQRGPAFDAPVERLFTTGTGASFLQVLHGGRRIWMWDGPDEMWMHTGDGWEKQAVAPEEHASVFSELGPSYRSYLGISHGGDSILYASQNGAALDLWLVHDTLTWAESHLASIPLPIGGSMSVACVNRTVDESSTPREQACHATTEVGLVTSLTRTVLAYPPYGDSALVAFSTRYTHAQLQGDWYRCPQENLDSIFFYECRNASGGTSAEGFHVYRVSLADGGFRLVETYAGAGLDELAISSDGREWVSRRITSFATFGTFTWEGFRPTDLRYTGGGGGTETCILRFTRWGIFGEREVENCAPHVGTFAASRARAAGGTPRVGPWVAQARPLALPQGRWLPALAKQRASGGPVRGRRPGAPTRGARTPRPRRRAVSAAPMRAQLVFGPPGFLRVPIHASAGTERQSPCPLRFPLRTCETPARCRRIPRIRLTSASWQRSKERSPLKSRTYEYVYASLGSRVMILL